jgi:DNA-binding transcriptional ArsR family regulator
VQSRNRQSKSTEKEQHTVIYSSQIRSMIIRLIAMYNELSLPQLSEIMEMKKTTIQYHLKILRENNIIYSSRDSHEDSRGSIPTKYYKLKQLRPDYHVHFNDLKKITNLEQRLEAYANFLQTLEAGLKDIITIISYAKEGIMSSRRRINDLNESKLSNKKLDELHKYISEVNLQFSTISIPKEVYSRIKNINIEFFEQIEKINKTYIKEEISKLKEQNLSEKEISDILKSDERFLEGCEVIAVLLPLKNLIDAQLVNKKQKIH